MKRSMLDDIRFMYRIEEFVSNCRPTKRARTNPAEVDMQRAVEICDIAKRLIHRGRKCENVNFDWDCDQHQTSEQEILRSAGMCDVFALKRYEHRLQHVPRVVNVVCRVVAEAVPNSGTTLPLDLHAIAARCNGAYFWPVRFCPVQIAFHEEPRTRILIFHTGKIVGTGSKGPMSARLAVMMTLRKLADEANIHLRVSSFEVKNLVGTVGLNATINCEGLAQRFSDKAHYDKSSFGGLQWRPFDKGICCEVFATGRMNLPNALSYSQLLEQFSTVEPILVQYSSLNAKSQVSNHKDARSSTEGADNELQEKDSNFEDLWDGWQ